MIEIVLLLHNIRSAHNVGALFRTADGLGVKKIICSGYTPYPELPKDTRLPHIREKITKNIRKTALGAETIVPFDYEKEPPLAALKKQGYAVVALEQAAKSTLLNQFKPPQKIALLLGEEVNGIEAGLLSQCDHTVEIPMRGQKESFNVSVAAGIALYKLLFR